METIYIVHKKIKKIIIIYDFHTVKLMVTEGEKVYI